MKKVLVVDDTKNIRVLLTQCLELEGYEVTTASDGLLALDLFEKEDFDLAFFDIKMPEISGTEVLRKIRKAGIKIPVIIITAYATIKNAVECTKMGAVAYLQKPFTADKVKSVLSELDNIQNIKNPDYDLKQITYLINEGLFNEALGLLKKAIASDPINAELFLLLSKTYECIGNSEHAKKSYKIFEVLNNK